MFGELEPEESSHSPLADRSLSVCLHASIIAFREPLNALSLFLELFRDLHYLLWAFCRKDILGIMYSMPCETCCHMWALHIVITTVMQSVSKYLYVHFGFVRYTLVSYSFIPSMRLIRDLSSAGPSQECECSITGRVPGW